MSFKPTNEDVNTNNEKTEIIKLLESNLISLDNRKIRLNKELLKIRREKNKILKEIETERVDRADSFIWQIGHYPFSWADP